jgi:hypothetical protein
MVKSGLEKEDPMNMQRRFGVLTAIAGAALALGSLTFAGSATATESSNYHDHTGNITTCPAHTIQFNGQIKTGSGSTALFHWAVTQNKYVAITQIDPTVTGLTAYLKGGDGYRVYHPVISGQQMRSPLNGGHNVPDLSHWMLCYTITPLVTTTTTIPEIVTTTTVVETTVIDTTTTVAETTTTVADTTTTTVPDVVTTTTIGQSDGPTTTLAATTTTEQASEGPTTTEQASEGPTTTVEGDPLPTTGGGASLPLVLGLALMLGGVLFTVLARTPRES